MSVLGIDIGGTFIKGGLVTGRGKIKTKRVVPTGPVPIRSLQNIVRSFFRTPGTSRIQAVGIGVPGMVDLKEGLIKAGGDHVYALLGVPIKKALRLSVPVMVDNDGNQAARGEKTFGKARSIKNFIHLTLGTGIGAGIYINGSLYRGRNGAGEIGHMGNSRHSHN